MHVITKDIIFNRNICIYTHMHAYSICILCSLKFEIRPGGYLNYGFDVALVDWDDNRSKMNFCIKLPII